MKSLALLVLSSAAAWAQDGINFGAEDGPFRLDLRPSLEAVVWSGDSPAPGLIDFGDDDALFAPRFSLESDAAAGERWLLHTTLRVDRGFDAGSKPDGEIRLDEAFLRWRPFDEPRLNFQIGKFPSAFGAWNTQHDFFDDPFLLAPLPYSQIIGIHNGHSPAPAGGGAGGKTLSQLSKDQWASTIWGPAYGTGASVFGATGHFDYAFEVKNSSLASHPEEWSELDFSQPTFTGRLGYRPDAAWALGVSASRGSWPEETIAGVDREELMQSTLGLDVRWAHHDFIVSGEVILSEFESPGEDPRAASYFIQGRWKIHPGVWVAARFGQMFANDAPTPGGFGGFTGAWQSDVWRAEVGAGWRLTPNVLLKADYSFTETADDPAAGEHLLGAGIGWRF